MENVSALYAGKSVVVKFLKKRCMQKNGTGRKQMMLCKRGRGTMKWIRL